MAWKPHEHRRAVMAAMLVPLLLGGLAVPTPAVAAGRSCESIRVSLGGAVTVLASSAAAPELARRPRVDTAYFLRAQNTSCATAVELGQQVVPAGDERAAVKAAGFRVVALKRLKLGGPALHRVGRRARRIPRVLCARWGRVGELRHRLGRRVERRARVYVKTCAQAAAPILARAPSRRTARPGRPRVKLRGRVSRCSPPRRLTDRQAQRAWALPEVPPGTGGVLPTPAACPLSFAAQGELLGRRSYCSTPGVVSLEAIVVVIGTGVVTSRVIGTGIVALTRHIELGHGDPQVTIDAAYQGVSGELAASARLRIRPACESPFRASRANVVARQNRVQGGLIGGFYTGQRVLTGDAFWVTTTP